MADMTDMTLEELKNVLSSLSEGAILALGAAQKDILKRKELEKRC